MRISVLVFFLSLDKYVFKVKTICKFYLKLFLLKGKAFYNVQF